MEQREQRWSDFEAIVWKMTRPGIYRFVVSWSLYVCAIQLGTTVGTIEAGNGGRRVPLHIAFYLFFYPSRVLLGDISLLQRPR
jgi:hypothetical protein